MTDQDTDNLNEKTYNQEIHEKQTKSYKHCKVERRENTNTQIYKGNYNLEHIGKGIQKVISYSVQEQACD